MKKLTKKEAKALSIKKWEYIVENNGKEHGLTEALPELRVLSIQCGYCEWNNQKSMRVSCRLCPIGGRLKQDYSCNRVSHPWFRWYLNATRKNAQAVLTLIKQS